VIWVVVSGWGNPSLKARLGQDTSMCTLNTDFLVWVLQLHWKGTVCPVNNTTTNLVCGNFLTASQELVVISFSRTCSMQSWYSPSYILYGTLIILSNSPWYEPAIQIPSDCYRNLIGAAILWAYAVCGHGVLGTLPSLQNSALVYAPQTIP